MNQQDGTNNPTAATTSIKEWTLYLVVLITVVYWAVTAVTNLSGYGVRFIVDKSDPGVVPPPTPTVPGIEAIKAATEEITVDKKYDDLLKRNQNMHVLKVYGFTTMEKDANNKIYYMPPMKSLAMWVRSDGYNGFSKVEPLTSEEISRRITNSDRNIEHLFYGMDLYMEMHNQTCVAMHHFSGYSGEPKKILSVNLGSHRFLHMINPELTGANSEGSVSSEIFNPICDRVVKIDAPPYTMVSYKITPKIAGLSEFAEHPDRIDSVDQMFFDKNAACVVMAIMEMKNTYFC